MTGNELAVIKERPEKSLKIAPPQKGRAAKNYGFDDEA